MALPALLRKLFKSSGYGSELNDGIVSKIISNQDWSNSYDYPVGVVARGSDDKLYYSVAQSGPGTSAGAKNPAQGGNSGFWKSFGSGDSIPTGTVLWLSTPSVPAGYLLCNGAAVGRATYPELFAAIGTTYGAGDGSTTFNLPNLIDKFAEGSAVAGTVKNAGLPDVTGQICNLASWDGSALTQAVNGIANNAFSNFGSKYAKPNVQAAGQGSQNNQDVYFSASNSNSIYGNSNTVQPPALTLLPCIKAFSSVVGDATVVAGQLVNDIQSKVALDGSNASAIGSVLSQYMANASMPSSDAAISIALPATGVDTAAMPCDGYVWFHGRSVNNINCCVVLQNNENWLSSSAFCNTSGWELDPMIPVRKGQKVRCHYTSGDLYEKELWLCPCVRH